MGVISGAAYAVHVSCLLGASSQIYGIFSGQSNTARCLIALPGWLGSVKLVVDGRKLGENKSALPRLLPGDSPLETNSTAATRDRMRDEFHYRGDEKIVRVVFGKNPRKVRDFFPFFLWV